MKKLILVAALLASVVGPVFAATAYWSGEQAFVTTVTYQQGVRCGYNYGGRIFYMVFVGGNCPMQVEVN